MTTIRIFWDEAREQWMATSDTPSLPKILRTVPVFGDDWLVHDSSATYAVEMVKNCNPGCRVQLGIGDR